MISAATELRFLGEELSDQKIKWQLLGNLLSLDYDSFVTTMLNLDEMEGEMTIKAIKEAIMRQEKMIQLQNERKGTNSSMPEMLRPIAATATAPGEQVEKKRCSECGMLSHKIENCWYAHPDKAPDWFEPQPRRSGSGRNEKRTRESRESRHNRGRSE